MEGTHFATMSDNETIYRWMGGNYISGGETLIKELSEYYLKEKTRITYLNETLSYIKYRTVVDRKQMDGQPGIINMLNGSYDYVNNEFGEHDPTDLSMSQIPIEYNEEMDCPEIKKFVNQIVAPEDVSIIQELFGYCLYKRYHIHKAFMFHGEGSNGKSTLINLLITFLGKENVASRPLQELCNDKFAKSDLYGKLANCYADLSSESMKFTGPFKLLTGEDMIHAEEKFKKGFKFINHAKLIFSCNQLPKVYDNSDAYFRRWIIINFPNTFSQDDESADKELLERLTAEQELSGLFNWALEGLGRLLGQGHFSYSPTTDQIRDQYERMSDSLSAFVMDRLTPDPVGTISKEELYKSYVQYCADYRLPCKNKIVLGRDLNQYAPYVSSYQDGSGKNRRWYWKGLKVSAWGEKHEEEPPENQTSLFSRPVDPTDFG